MKKVNSETQILIVDDEERSRNILKKIIEKYCQKVKVIGLAESAEKAHAIFNQRSPNLIFLDVEMPHATGFDFLEMLPEDHGASIVFVTGFDHYALKAIKFNALDYLLKPVDIDEVVRAVEKSKRILNTLNSPQEISQFLDQVKQPTKPISKLAIPTISGREIVDIENIVHCDSDGNVTWFHLSDGRKLFSSKNLGEYEKMFSENATSPPYIFFRVHHGHIINIGQIKIVNSKSNFVQMVNGTKILIAQRRKASFIELLKKNNLY